MENLRKRRKIDLVTSKKKIKKLAAQPSFKLFQIFHPHLVVVERKETNLCLNRPISVGFSVLDLSKTLMYDFHYRYVKEKYPGSLSKLLFTDTDSLTYAIETNDVFTDMLEDKDLFDFSDYPPNHPCFSLENKKVIGKFKDEMGSRLIFEFLGLKAKMYSVKSTSGKECVKAKGVSKAAAKKKLSHDHYRHVIETQQTVMVTMNAIRSNKHQILTLCANKKALSVAYDKRYILDDGISTLAYGHYSIE